jgi:hypothetical protein
MFWHTFRIVVLMVLCYAAFNAPCECKTVVVTEEAEGRPSRQ